MIIERLEREPSNWPGNLKKKAGSLQKNFFMTRTPESGERQPSFWPRRLGGRPSNPSRKSFSLRTSINGTIKKKRPSSVPLGKLETEQAFSLLKKIAKKGRWFRREKWREMQRVAQMTLKSNETYSALKQKTL